MSDVKSGRVMKGQIRCFRCHLVTRCRDGAWREGVSQQVFMCHTCKRILSRALAPDPARQ